MKVISRAADYQKHAFDVNTLVFWKGKLYSGGDDGKIKVWSEDLNLLGEVQAHPTTVLSIDVCDNGVYSCSNDGTVKIWELDTLKEKLILVKDATTEFAKVHLSNGLLYTGDSDGNINVYKQDKFYGSFNIAEPVKDMLVHGQLLFTAKDLDMAINEVKTDSERLQFGTKKMFTGRAPLALAGERICFSSREGKDILIHESSDQKGFQQVTEIKDAHKLVINTLAGTNWNNKETLFSGGWDKQVKKWSIEGNTAKETASCNADIVVNVIAIGAQDRIYAAGSDRKSVV